MTDKEKDQFNELKKEVKKANQRIARIERIFGYGSWGVKHIYDYLDTDFINVISKKGRILLKEDYSQVKIRAIRREVNRFLKNTSVSTLRGIRKKIKEIKVGFEDRFDMTDKQAEEFFQAFNEDLIKWLYQYVEPSDFALILQEGRELNYSYYKFERVIFSVSSELKRLIEELNDLDAKDKLQRIYDRYVRG